jgi:hypothetical protein
VLNFLYCDFSCHYIEGKKRARKTAEYVPKYRSAPWGILLALRSAADSVGYLTKQDIIKTAQPHADAPLDMPGPGGIYAGWASMSTLLDKELVMKYGNPPRFALSEEGRNLADKMIACMKNLTATVSGEAAEKNLRRQFQGSVLGSDSSDDDVMASITDDERDNVPSTATLNTRKRPHVATSTFKDMDLFNLKSKKQALESNFGIPIPISNTKSSNLLNREDAM